MISQTQSQFRAVRREQPRSARSDRRRRRRRPHRFDAAVAARRRASARERAADDVDPAEGARAEPEDDGDPGRRRCRGGDLREGHAGREHARDGLVRGARRSRPRVRATHRADRELGRRLHQSQLDGGEPVPLGQPSADPPRADLQGARGSDEPGRRALPPRADRARAGCRRRDVAHPQSRRRQRVHGALEVPDRLRRRPHDLEAGRHQVRRARRGRAVGDGAHQRGPVAHRARSARADPLDLVPGDRPHGGARADGTDALGPRQRGVGLPPRLPRRRAARPER